MVNVGLPIINPQKGEYYESINQGAEIVKSQLKEAEKKQSFKQPYVGWGGEISAQPSPSSLSSGGYQKATEALQQLKEETRRTISPASAYYKRYEQGVDWARRQAEKVFRPTTLPESLQFNTRKNIISQGFRLIDTKIPSIQVQGKTQTAYQTATGSAGIRQPQQFTFKLNPTAPKIVEDIAVTSAVFGFFSPLMNVGSFAEAAQRLRAKGKFAGEEKLTVEEAEAALREAYLKGDSESIREALRLAYEKGNNQQIREMENLLKRSLGDSKAAEIIKDVEQQTANTGYSFLVTKEPGSIFAAKPLPTKEAGSLSKTGNLFFEPSANRFADESKENILTWNGKSETRNKEQSKTINILGTSEKTKTQTKQGEGYLLKEKNNFKQQEIPKSKFLFSTMTTQKTRQPQKYKQMFDLRFKQPQLFKPGKPSPRNTAISLFKKISRNPKIIESGYNVFTGVKKNKLIASNLPKGEALWFGQKYVKRDLAASFRLLPSGSPAISGGYGKTSQLNKLFTPSKRNPGFFIERRENRLDFFHDEVKQIQAARNLKEKVNPLRGFKLSPLKRMSYKIGKPISRTNIFLR